MKSLTDVFRTLQTLQSEGAVLNYAVGGTVAALFAAEATCCFEISVCTFGLGQPAEQVLNSWARNYEFVFRDGLLVVHGVPLRLLEQSNALEHEAVLLAELKQYAGVSVRVMCAERLIALYLDKRHSRWGYSPSYFSAESLEPLFLEEVLERADLLSKWQLWQELKRMRLLIRTAFAQSKNGTKKTPAFQSETKCDSFCNCNNTLSPSSPPAVPSSGGKSLGILNPKHSSA